MQKSHKLWDSLIEQIWACGGGAEKEPTRRWSTGNGLVWLSKGTTVRPRFCLDDNSRALYDNTPITHYDFRWTSIAEYAELLLYHADTTGAVLDESVKMVAKVRYVWNPFLEAFEFLTCFRVGRRKLLNKAVKQTDSQDKGE